MHSRSDSVSWRVSFRVVHESRLQMLIGNIVEFTSNIHLSPPPQHMAVGRPWIAKKGVFLIKEYLWIKADPF